MIGSVQIASIGLSQASGEPEAWAAWTRIPVATPAAVSQAAQPTPKTNIATRQISAGIQRGGGPEEKRRMQIPDGCRAHEQIPRFLQAVCRRQARCATIQAA